MGGDCEGVRGEEKGGMSIYKDLPEVAISKAMAAHVRLTDARVAVIAGIATTEQIELVMAAGKSEAEFLALECRCDCCPHRTSEEWSDE